MAAIPHSDLFDFPGYEAGIKKALDLSVDFGKTMDGVLARIRKEQKGLIADLKQYEQILRGFNTSSSTAANGLGGLNKQIGSTVRELTDLKAVSAGVASIINLQKASIEELKAEYTGIQKQLERLKPDQAGYADEVARLTARLKQVTPQIKEYNTNLKNSTTTIKHAEGSYKAMQQQLGMLRTRLRDMPNAFDQVTGKMNKNNKEAVALQREISKLDNVMKQADKSMGIFYRNVGNYSSALNGVNSNLGSLAARFVSITAVIGLLRQSLDISGRMQALNTAIQALSSSNEEFGQNQQFLSGIAEKYGQDIFTLTNAYKGLMGATRGTNLEGLKSKKIFESVVQAASVMKLSNEQVEGSLLAIQQMLSKGTVSAEELRGQLGERLPGAFRIFADSLGVTEIELNKMLKAGEVLSEDALPKFAARLNELYGDKAISGAQALVNEQNRLNNAWNELLNSDKVAGFFAKLYGKLAGFVKDVNYTIKNNDWATFFMSAGEVTTKRKMEEKNAADVQTYLQNFEAKTEKERSAAIQERINKIKSLQGQMSKLNENEAKALAKTIARNQQLLQEQLAIVSRLGVNTDKASNKPGGGTGDDKALTAAKRKMDQQQALLKKGYELDLQNLELQLAQKEVTQEQFEQKKFQLSSSYAGAAYSLELEMGKNKDDKRILDIKEFLAKEETEYLKAQAEREEKLNARLNAKRGMRQTTDENAFKPNNGYVNPFSGDVAALGEKATGDAAARANSQIEAENKAFDVIRAGRDTSFKEELAHLNRLKDIRVKNKQSTAEEEYAISVLNAERERALQEQTADFLFQTVGVALNALQDSANAKFEARIGQLEEEKSRQMEAAGSNAAARERIEKQYNQKIAKEKRKQAQSDKTYALFNVGINTAQGVAKSIAQWGMPFALPFIALTVATGLIQAAAIASKPLPAYKKGTKSAAAGLGIAGEAGRELMEHRGKFMMIDKPTLIDFKGGERVYSNQETEKLAAQALNQEEVNRITQASLITKRATVEILKGKHQQEVNALTVALKQSGIGKIPEAIATALDGLPLEVHRFDERGYTKAIKQKGDTTTYINSRHA